MDARTTQATARATPTAATTTSTTATHTLTVSGMSCGSCVQHVTDEVQKVGGVDTVAVDLAASTVTVTGAGLDVESVRAAITEAGYESATTAAV